MSARARARGLAGCARRLAGLPRLGFRAACRAPGSPLPIVWGLSPQVTNDVAAMPVGSNLRADGSVQFTPCVHTSSRERAVEGAGRVMRACSGFWQSPGARCSAAVCGGPLSAAFKLPGHRVRVMLQQSCLRAAPSFPPRSNTCQPVRAAGGHHAVVVSPCRGAYRGHGGLAWRLQGRLTRTGGGTVQVTQGAGSAVARPSVARCSSEPFRPL